MTTASWTDPLFSFSSPWSYWLLFLAVSWPLAWLGHAAMARLRPDLVDRHWPWHRLVGVALVLWPFVKHAYGVYTSFALVLDTGSVAGTTPAWVWWLTIERRWWQYVALPLFGLFLAFAPQLRALVPDDFGARIRHTLSSISAWPERGLSRDIVNGFGIFVIVYVTYLLIAVALSPLRRFDTGDESAVFGALDPTLAFALALTAGVTEEVIFRGILQSRLRLVMPTWVAVGVQAVFFGLIHSGYGTVGHIVLPAIFGLAMGVVVLRFGLIPAILVHTLVDLVLFLYIATDNGAPWAATLVPFLFLAGIALPGAFYANEWWNRRYGRAGPTTADWATNVPAPGPEAVFQEGRNP